MLPACRFDEWWSLLLTRGNGCNRKMQQTEIPALIRGDVSVHQRSKVTATQKCVPHKQEMYKCKHICDNFRKDIFSDVAVSSYWYQMHPRIDWNTDPRTSDISRDSKLSRKVCGLNAAKHTHSATYKFTLFFHWASVLLSQTAPSAAAG